MPRRYSTSKVKDIEAHFWTKVDIKGPDECWPWKAYCKENGYGQFYIDRKPFYAHRIALELSGVKLEPTQTACHKCDNPPCCNPNHLFPGSQLDNVHDMLNKGRGKPNKPARSLSNEEISLIRELSATGNYSFTAISKIIGCSRTYVAEVVKFEKRKAG